MTIHSSTLSRQRTHLAALLAAVAGSAFTLASGLHAQDKQPNQQTVPGSDPASDPNTPGDPVTPANQPPAPKPPAPGAGGPAGGPVVKPGVGGAPGSNPPKAGAGNQVNPPKGGAPVNPNAATPGTRPNANPPANGPKPGPATPAPAASNTPGGKPAANGSKAMSGGGDALPGASGPVGQGNFRYGPFPEPVELKLLANEIARHLGIQYIGDTSLANKTAFLPTALDVPADQLMTFLALILEQNGLTVKATNVGKIYQITPATDNAAGEISDDKFAPTQIIPTPGIKPSSLQIAIAAINKGAAAPPGGGQSAPGAAQVAYLDDLGVIVVTDSPRRIGNIVSLIEALVKEQGKQELVPFNVRHLSAPAARSRILEFINKPISRTFDPNQQQQGAPVAGSGSVINNLAERLYTHPTANQLLFRGRTDEVELLNRLLDVIDVPSDLTGKWYGIASAPMVAQHASRNGLGEVVTLQSTSGANTPGQPGFNQPVPGRNPAIAGGEVLPNGPTILVDGQGRGFTYYATPTLHERMDLLVKDLEKHIEAETIVMEHYKIRHSKADEIETIIRALITNTVPSGGSTLLPGGQPNQNQAGMRTTPVTRPTGGQPTDPENAAIEATAETFVIADKSNSQIIVKAPKRMQAQFARLISKLDLRRPQVFVEAKIVVIDENDNWRLAFEQQYLRFGGTSYAARTVFGAAASVPTGGITAVPTVAPAAQALTAAILKSDEVPLVMTALAGSVDARIVASPKLLVDDNEEAEISAIREIPYATTTQTVGNPSTTTLGGFQEAGPRLKVTPQISSGDYLRLKYELELSSFVGDPPAGVTVPPRQTSKVSNESVTIPSDSTIVVGGLQLDDVSKTVFKVPLIGDVPLVGQLFRDERENKTKRTIYVFITPRVMRDTDFNDIRLLSVGPIAAAKVSDPVPAMIPPTFIPMSTSSPIGPRALPPLPGMHPADAPPPMTTPVPINPENAPAAATPPAHDASPVPAPSPSNVTPATPTAPPQPQPPEPVRPPNDPTARATPAARGTTPQTVGRP